MTICSKNKQKLKWRLLTPPQKKQNRNPRTHKHALQQQHYQAHEKHALIRTSVWCVHTNKRNTLLLTELVHEQHTEEHQRSGPECQKAQTLFLKLSYIHVTNTLADVLWHIQTWDGKKYYFAEVRLTKNRTDKRHDLPRRAGLEELCALSLSGPLKNQKMFSCDDVSNTFQIRALHFNHITGRWYDMPAARLHIRHKK